MAGALRNLRPAWLLLLLLSLACALPAAVTSTPMVPAAPVTTLTPTAAPLAGTPVPVSGGSGYAFAPYVEPPPPAVASALLTTPTPLAFDQLVNAVDLWPLDEAGRARLAAQGFVVTGPTVPHFSQIYQAAAADGRPTFITVDALLHTCQALFQATWHEVERDYLVADLAVLVPALVEITQAQQITLGSGSEAAAAARHNLAYFSVAARLLDPEFELVAAVADVVQDELTLIASASGAFASPLMGTLFDYRQLQPPPAYADTVARTRYFQAMTWLTVMGWPIGNDAADSRRTALQSLLLLRGLADSQNEARWERLAVVNAFFRGRGAGLSLPELEAAAAAVYGAIPTLGRLEERTSLDTFSLTLAQMAPAGAVQLFQFTPEPLFWEDALWPQLLFNQVGPYLGEADPLPLTALASEVGVIRTVPRAFDVAALLGSDRAAFWLNQAGDDQYEGYLAQRSGLAAAYAGWEAVDWTRTLAGAWLYAQQPLLAPASTRFLPYAADPAWQDLRLNSWFGGWSQARAAPYDAGYSDTDVSATAPVVGFVAPEPVLFARLAGLTGQIRNGLTERALLDATTAGRLATLEEILLTLQLIAVKEAAGRQLSAAELTFIATMGDQMAALLPPLPAGDAFATAVYQDESGGRQLQAGAYGARPLFVLVPAPAGVVVAVGAVYDLFETTIPLGQPAAAPAGERPLWTGAFALPPPEAAP